MTTAVVTSFSPSGYELYGRRMLQTFEKYWPHDIPIYVYYEGDKPQDATARAQWLPLDGDTDRAAFAKSHKDHPTDYNQQPVKFSHKVFALTSAPRDTEWLIWLDGDVETTAFITHRLIKSLFPPDIDVAAYLGRSWWNHTETGFVAYHLTDTGKQFLDDLRKMYTEGHIVNLENYRGVKQQHDCAAFDVLRETYEAEGHTFYDMGGRYTGPDLDVMAHTPLERVMYHYKGNRKHIVIANRYDQLIKLIDRNKPKTIIEVGTHHGKRAERMARAALKHNPNVHYIGYDLFDVEAVSGEKNGKGLADEQGARTRLDDVKEANPGFTWELHKGDTRKTLHGKNVVADFAFIDGGHSVETIKGDFEALQSCKLIALDDYYVGKIDTNKFGCNEVLKKSGRTFSVLPWGDPVKGGGWTRIAVVGDYDHKIARAGKRPRMTEQMEALFDQQRELLAKYGDPTVSAKTFGMWENDPEIDKEVDIIFVVNILEHIQDYHGALEKIRKLAKQGALFSIQCDLMRDAETWENIIGMYFRINDTYSDTVNNRVTISTDSNVLVPGVKPIAPSTDTGRWENIKSSCAKFKNYLEPKPPHDRRAILACYGPSLKDYIEKLKEEAPDCDVFSVSGSHDYLIEHGIIPNYHVECDPRPHKSIHITPRPEITYLLAASCHPDLFNKMDPANVRLWHAEEHIRVRDELKNEAPNVAGGGSVGLRAIGALYVMGYRNITLYGMDCSFEDAGEKQHAGKHAGKRQDVCLNNIEGRDFYTSPVLMTYAANFFDMVKVRPDISWRIYGDGMLQNWIRFATKLAQKDAA